MANKRALGHSLKMRAKLKRLHSPDIYDLRAFIPEEPDKFGFLLQAMIGPEGLEGRWGTA